jgi:hypothetical protein
MDDLNCGMGKIPGVIGICFLRDREVTLKLIATTNYDVYVEHGRAISSELAMAVISIAYSIEYTIFADITSLS